MSVCFHCVLSGRIKEVNKNRVIIITLANGREENEMNEISQTLSPHKEAVNTIKTGKCWCPAFLPEILRIMEEHGGNAIEHGEGVIFYFPTGTFRQLMLPETQSSRWIIFFPDGFQVRQHELPTGNTALSFPDNAFSEELQRKYPAL